MRSGGYTLQQSLALEAASIVKQALSLARRRGHAQVTPLHVASAMLSSSSNYVLRKACLQSYSHPLQCKALELCFNVALNRLPTSVSGPLLGPQSHFPSLSNALVAAFKRAQAHQRRGCIENQQQPILALKVEIEQLVISILDDPSVSRVMREAGFSSTQVKTNVQKAVSLEICNNSKSVSSGQPQELNTKPLLLANTSISSEPTSSSQFRLSSSKIGGNQVNNDDVMTVLEVIMNKKTKNSVIIGQSVSTAEGVVRGLIDMFDKKEVPVEMRSVQFISVPLFTLKNISREEFEARVGELRSLVKSYGNSGVVLYLGDLRWVSEFWSERRNNTYYCPVEYMIMEISRLTCGSVEKKRLWLMGIATSETYEKCKIRRPSLETLWSLNPLTIPFGTLALSLSLDMSDMHDKMKKEPVDDYDLLFENSGIKKHLSCCTDCLDNFKKDAQAALTAKHEFFTSTSNSSLPLWLQQYKDENRKQANMYQEFDKIKDLCKKWNSICSSVHRKPHFLEKVFNISSPSPCSSTSISSNGQSKSKLQQTLLNWPLIFEPNDRKDNDHDQSDIEISKPSYFQEITKHELLSNPNSSPNSASSSEATQEILDFSLKFKELNAESLNILCHALEKKVPWQRDLIPEICKTVLKCRSGMTSSKRRRKNEEINREECFLFFLGVDSDGKETIARELAKVVFGSYDNFVPIKVSSFSENMRDDLSEEAVSKNKRSRNENGGTSYDRFVDAIRDNPSRVFLIEDVDAQLDFFSLKRFENAIEYGFVPLCDGERVSLKDAIVIFSSESFESGSRTSTKRKFIEKEEINDEFDEQMHGALDLNVAMEDSSNSISEIKILDLVDHRVVFKIQVL